MYDISLIATAFFAYAWWTPLLVLFLVWGLAATAVENFPAGAVALNAGGFAAVAYYYGIDSFSIPVAAAMMATYFVVGVGVVLLKWRVLLYEAKLLKIRARDAVTKSDVNEYSRVINESVRFFGQSRLLDRSYVMGERVELKLSDDFASIRPRASDHRSRIISWMSAWPSIVIYTACTKSFTLVYYKIAATLDRMSDSAFGVESDS